MVGPIICLATLAVLTGDIARAEDWLGTLQTAGHYLDAKTRDSLIFVASDWGFEVLSIANPGSPIRISSTPTPGSANRIEIDDRYAYVADQGDALLVFDCLNPASPVLVQRLDQELTDVINGEVAIRDMLLVDTILYVASPNGATGQGLHIYNVADPAMTYLVSRIQLSQSPDTLTTPYALTHFDTVMYVLDLWGLWVVDISDPGHPATIGLDWHPAGSPWQPSAAIANASRLTMFEGLLISFNVAPPAVPFVTAVQIPSDTADKPPFALQIQDLALGDTVLWIAAYADGLKSAYFPAASTDTVQISGRYDTPGLASSIDFSDSLMIVGDDMGVFVAKRGPTRLDSLGYFANYKYITSIWRVGRFIFGRAKSQAVVVDVTVPGSPALADSMGFTNLWQLQASAERLYASDLDAANQTTYLDIFDLADTLHPVRLTRYELPTRKGRSFAVRGGYSYHADPKFSILSVENPDSVYLVGQVSGSFSGDGNVALGSTHAFASYGSRLFAIDISDPTNPTVVDPLGAPYSFHEAVVRDTLLIAVDEGLWVLNVRDPASISVVSFRSAQGTTHMELRGNRAFLAPYKSKVIEYDLTDPLNPIPDSMFTTPASAFGLASDDSMLFVGDGLGITVFRIETSSPVSEPGPSIPIEFSLGHNYPNPFNAVTVIPFEMKSAGRAALSVHNTLGRQIDARDLGFLPAGRHSVRWPQAPAPMEGLPSGVYVYRITVGPSSLSRKMIYLK